MVLSIELPKEAENIIVNKITYTNESYSETETPLQEESSPSQEESLTENNKSEKKIKDSQAGITDTNNITSTDTIPTDIKNIKKNLQKSVRDLIKETGNEDLREEKEIQETKSRRRLFKFQLRIMHSFMK